jgi:PPP family 3-phenylpropionic acid transporter
MGWATYLKLSNLYFWFFALLGALLPFWALYLEYRGLSYVQIGLLMATLQLTKVLAPNVWGWLADRTGQRMALVRLGSGVAAAAFLGVLLEPGFYGLMAIMLVFSFFWNAVLPLYEVVTLHNLGERRQAYSRVRLWGSVGFIGSVILIGEMLSVWSVGLLPWLLVPIFLGIALSAWVSLEEPEARRRNNAGPVAAILRQPAVWSFLLVNLLLQASHGPYYTFFSIHLRQLGYTESSIGMLWSLGVLAEIGLFVVMHRILRLYSLRSVAIVALLLTTLRWSVTASLSESLPLLLLMQLLHAASFGALHAIAIHFIHGHFGEGHQGKGQALYSGLSYGAGGALGAWLSGVVVEAQGTAMAFWLGAGLAAGALVVAAFWLRPEPDKRFAY